MEAQDVSYDAMFKIHRQRHPEVLPVLVRYAKIERLKGKTRVSIRVIWELARLENPGLGGLNDHFHSRYARLIMELEPELRGMFATRRLRSN